MQDRVTFLDTGQPRRMKSRTCKLAAGILKFAFNAVIAGAVLSVNFDAAGILTVSLCALLPILLDSVASVASLTVFQAQVLLSIC